MDKPRTTTEPGEHGPLARLFRPLDVAALAAFRIVFGLVLLASVLRFIANGWVSRFFVERTFYFKYWGFEWVRPWSETGMYAHVGALAVLAVLVTIGWFYRAAIVLFFLGFTYIELIDVTNYLNHYYLVSLLCLVCCFLPLNRAWSVDAWRDPSIRAATLPAWMTYAVRFQVGVVYFFAGLAKLGEDWLLRAQPLGHWLASRTDAPIVGPLLGERSVAYAMSWAGFLFDTTIVAWLLWSRSRPFAYAVVLVFHTATGMLFNIGMFPFIMVTAALIFFSPSWPRRLLPPRLHDALRRTEGPAEDPPAAPDARFTPVRRAAAIGLATFALFQLAFPFRHLAYPGNVLWNEQGMRWSWKVKVRAKRGSITYRVTDPEKGRTVFVAPRRYLTSYQEEEMAGQPDLILQLAHHIARDFRTRGWSSVEVRVDALVSLNGRPPARLIDPDVNLAQIQDGLGTATWILPEPGTTPPSAIARLEP